MAASAMKVLLLEDDYIQAQTLTGFLRSQFSGVEVVSYPTEALFIDAIPRMRGEPPTIGLFDLMLPFQFLGENNDERGTCGTPGDFTKAGLRCWQRLQEYPELST